MLSLGGVHDSTSAGPVGFHSVNSGGMTSALIGMVGGGLLILLVLEAGRLSVRTVCESGREFN